MKKTLIIAFTLCVGIGAGVASTFGYYLYANRTTTICVATDALAGDRGLHVPAGTEMVYDRAMPEGFYRVRLYLNLDAQTYNSKTARHVEQKSFLIPPSWVR